MTLKRPRGHHLDAYLAAWEASGKDCEKTALALGVSVDSVRQRLKTAGAIPAPLRGPRLESPPKVTYRCQKCSQRSAGPECGVCGSVIAPHDLPEGHPKKPKVIMATWGEFSNDDP